MPDENSQEPGAALGELLKAVVRYAGPRMGGTLAIIALAAVLEGVGLVLLLPVAEVIFAAEGAAQTGLTGKLIGWLAGLGFESVLEQLSAIGIAFLLLVGIRAVVLLRRDVLLMELSQGFVDEVRRNFFSLLTHSDWPVIKRYRKADLLNAMTTNIGRLSMAMRFLSTGIVLLAMGVAYLASAFIVSVELGLALLILIGVGLFFAALWTRRSHSLGSWLNRANRGVMHETTTFLDGMKAAKAARAEDELTERFVQSIAETREISVQFVRQQGRLRNAIQFIAAVAALLVLMLGFGVVGLTGGELLVMAAIVIRIAPTLATNFTGMQSLAHALPAFEAIRQTERELEAFRAANGNAGDILAEGARVPPADQPLKAQDIRVDVTNAQGETVTLVKARELWLMPGMLVHVGGPSGAGKSSLVELLAGLHLPASGSVSRGNFSLTASTRPAWQSRVSFAPQEPFLFDGTVRENLLWPNLEASDDALWDALEKAEADHIVRSLPLGLDEDLLDGGARLSGGERQRLCLARALLRPADLVILDEATSAMDPELERLIVGRIKQNIGERIVLMVSHSLNAVGHADSRIEVQDGVVRLAD